MRDADAGRNVACLGDTTDHGGEVIEAAPDLSHMRRRVALDRHLVRCPKCDGDFRIKASGRRKHHGIAIAYIGDETECGAKLQEAA